MDNIFSVKNEDLARLSPQEAVEFFRELLWAEARRIGIGISKIHISSWINVPDGGVDAVVEENIASVQSDLIKPGFTAYEIKAGESFKPWQNKQIEEELFKGKSPSKENLGNSIKACLDKGGIYVLVCFKQDLTAEQHRKAVEALKSNLSPCGYQNPRVEVWSQNNLIGFLKRYPSLALKINQRERIKFQTHKSWSQDAEMRRDFKAGRPQQEFIASMQNALRKNDRAFHIHVWGEPGIGKTRLVLEATRADDLQPLIIYCDSPSKFRDSDLMNEILKDDNQFSVILVIDECDSDSRSYIWNKLKYRGSRIKLITIYNDYDKTSGEINYLKAPPLDIEHISEIIQGYSIPKDQAVRWAELCDGFPRVAHVFGQNLKNNPEDLLKPPDTINVWERHIVGGDDPNSDQVRQRRLVLQHIALFKRFGFRRPFINEARAVAKKIEQADPQITWARFQEIIKDLKDRKILQGEYTLYITPKVLHIKLWIDWWNTYGEGFDFEEFIEDLPDSLRDWFYEMFKYASESEVASRIVEELLGEAGPFQNKDYLRKEDGAKFFLALAEANPKAALKRLKRTVGAWSKEELLRFTTGRREVVWALEKIAMWRELFPDAARLLLALGEAENEPWSNNASGVFVQLFSPAPGKVAPTEAPPQERLPILKEALESRSKEKRMLGLRACDQALESQHFVRMIGAEYQGLHKTPQLWTPKTYKELFDAYRKVWQMLYELLDDLSDDERQEAVNIFLSRAGGLVQIQNLADMVIDTLSELAKKSYVGSKRVLSEVIQILHYDGKRLPLQICQRLKQLKEDLTGNDFSSLMKRYVGMDLLEDKFDEKGNIIDQTQLQIEELVKQAVENHDLLRSELNWLVTTEAQNGYLFGYELGKRDKDFSLLPLLLEAQRKANKNASVYFLGGYFRALFERNSTMWEEQLDALIDDKKLNIWIPELTWRSGISNRAAIRILDLAEEGMIDVGHFKMFSFGGVIRDLSEDVFKKWIEFLLKSSETYAISIALDLYHSYYLHKKSTHILPQDLTFRLLTHQSLFQKSEKGKRNQMDEYHWTEIGKVFIQLYPQKSLELADKMLEHFGEDGTILEGFHSQVQAVLNEIVKLFPCEVWKKITKYLGPPIDSRAFHIKEWLRGGEFYKEKKGALTFIPLEEIWKWVDEDVENRAWYLATFVPKTLFYGEGKVCLAREILIRYGNREDVRRNLIANFSTEGWTGSASAHYQKKKEFLLKFKKKETNQNVIDWINEYVSILDEEIERAKIGEEREVF